MCAVASSASAADLEKLDRTIKKEPVYQTKSPRYALLVFGPQAKDRVWLVHDGDTLYVDRNGNGDLTETGKKVIAKGDKERDPEEGSYQFEAGELRIGGRIHKGLKVGAWPLTLLGDRMLKHSNAKAALAADPKTRSYALSLAVEKPLFKGQGVGGRTVQIAGYLDGNGVLLFANKPADAPVIHFEGPLQITLYGEKPTLTLGRSNDLFLAVGTPGQGPGSFASLGYEDTIPSRAIPKVEIMFPPRQKGDPPLRETYELKERC
jgi:hypothetical protein